VSFWTDAQRRNVTEARSDASAAGVYIHGTDPRSPHRWRGRASDVTNRSSREAVDSQTWFDETSPSRPPHAAFAEHPLMYDLTVAGTRNFNLYNEIANQTLSFHRNRGRSGCRCTTHPRSAQLRTTNPKAPVMNIYSPAAQRERSDSRRRASASRPRTCANGDQRQAPLRRRRVLHGRPRERASCT
jgi:hypothetical protein